MRAAVLEEKGRVRVKDFEKPQITSKELLLKIKACSICGTDRKIYEHGREQIEGQQILGHEIAGEIIEIGEEVKYYEEGMRVTLAPNIGCGYCHVCRRGWQQLCPDFRAFGIGIPGGFAEYMKVPAPAIRRGNLTEIPDNLSYASGALIEPLACCFNARQSIDIQPGENLLIFGAGIMGHFHLILNQVLGIGEVIMVDIDKRRLEMSEKYGADHTIDSSAEDLREVVFEITDGRGMDNIITAAPVAAVQKQALELLDINGAINFFAGIAGEEKIPVSSNDLHYKQQVLTGTTGSSVQQFRQTAKITKNNNLDLEDMITKAIDLEELETIFEKDEIFRENMKIQVQFN